MSVWIQYSAVIVAVGVAAAFLLRQAWLVLAGRRSRLGSCCAKGCGAQQLSASRIHFLPVEMLSRRK